MIPSRLIAPLLLVLAVVILTAFVVGSLTAFPVIVLILVTGLLYGPGWGMVYAQCGIALGAAASFQLGRHLGGAGWTV